MRRPSLIAASSICLAGAMAVGPFGTAAAAPYVYGCNWATYTAQTAYTVYVAIYNGSSTTATLIHKVLASNGTILNATLTGSPPSTSSIGPTHSGFIGWLAPANADPASDNATVPASVRIVSNVPVAATLSHGFQLTGSFPIPIPCLPIQP